MGRSRAKIRVTFECLRDALMSAAADGSYPSDMEVDGVVNAVDDWAKGVVTFVISSHAFPSYPEGYEIPFVDEKTYPCPPPTSDCSGEDVSVASQNSGEFSS